MTPDQLSKVATAKRDVGWLITGLDQSPLTIELPLSRAEIADYLGLRLETVSRQLNRLEAAAVIKRVARRGITIREPRELERLAGEPLQ